MKRVIFKHTDNGFFDAAKKAVDEYFYKNNLKKTGTRNLYIKTGLFIPMALFIYTFLLFGNYSSITGIGLSILLGLSFSFIAINIMHDACHGSFAEKKWINTMMGLTMNALGSNAFLWKIKHNILHHTYTNIDGIDNDIAHWPVLRQSPAQKWRPFHRYQFLYMFPLYALSTIEWMLIGDFAKYFSGKISATPIMRFSLKEHLVFWISKIFYVVFYIVIPCWFLGWQSWLTGFMIVHFIMGLSLTIIFQLAHLVENTSFGKADKEVNEMPTDWAIHEIMTTSNFATGNKLVSWFAGGLNFQIEHHLFPRISHVHYPAISEIIRKECVKHHLPYHCYPDLYSAFVSHIRLMKDFGKRTNV